jgi:hypothetical protein
MTGPVDTASVVPGRSCGTCSMCCKLFNLPELESPAGKWCRHCEPGRGCKIHAARPEVCRSFFCGWLVSPDLGPEWKPERAKLIIRTLVDGETMPCIAVNVEESFPTAWQRPEIYRRLKQTAIDNAAGGILKLVVRVQIGRRQIAILPERDVDLGIVEDDEEIKFVMDGRTIDVKKVKRQSVLTKGAFSAI